MVTSICTNPLVQNIIEVENLGKPIYKIPFVAKVTGIKSATIRSWLYGYKYNSYGDERWFAPILVPYPREKLTNPNRLKVGLDTIIELVYLNELINVIKNSDQDYKVLDRIRKTVQILREEFCTDHPFLHPSSYGIFNEPFNERLSALIGDMGKFRYRIANLRSRIYWNAPGFPTKFFPFPQIGMYLSISLGINDIFVDQTSIKTVDIVNALIQGKNICQIAEEFNIEENAVESAIRYEINR